MHQQDRTARSWNLKRTKMQLISLLLVLVVFSSSLHASFFSTLCLHLSLSP